MKNNKCIRPTFGKKIDYFTLSVARGMTASIVVSRRVRTCMPHVLYCYVICIMVNHQLLNVDNHYDSLIKYAIIVKYIGYSCLNKQCWHIYINTRRSSPRLRESRAIDSFKRGK